MAISIEEKLMLAIALIIALLGGGALFCIHLIDAGKDEEKAAVFAVQQKDEAKAAAETAGWKSQLADAKLARQEEIDHAMDAALNPVTSPVAPGVVQKWALSPAVSASPAPPGASASAAGSGPVCSGLVPGSSAEMRSFNDAKSADQLIADYRDLYNSWPTIGTTR